MTRQKLTPSSESDDKSWLIAVPFMINRYFATNIAPKKILCDCWGDTLDQFDCQCNNTHQKNNGGCNKGVDQDSQVLLAFLSLECEDVFWSSSGGWWSNCCWLVGEGLCVVWEESHLVMACSLVLVGPGVILNRNYVLNAYRGFCWGFKVPNYVTI